MAGCVRLGSAERSLTGAGAVAKISKKPSPSAIPADSSPRGLSQIQGRENRFEIFFFFHNRLFRLTGGHYDICKAGTTS